MAIVVSHNHVKELENRNKGKDVTFVNAGTASYPTIFCLFHNHQACQLFR